MTLSLAQIETLAKRLLDAQDQAAAILQISNGIAANLNRSTRK